VAITILWMLLNGWFAKVSFEQDAPISGWICLCSSAWYLGRVMVAIFLGSDMFEIWDGDLFLYTVDSTYEADEAEETGFRVVPISQE